ncbi:outer membrane beta-barrel protein [bacterium]|nr:outer membrane beta-barrel protein [bacterium]
MKKLLFALSVTILTISSSFGQSRAQDLNPDFEDYEAFESDPIELDQEVRDYFGRFFQSSLLMGTGIFTSGLGRANSAGFLIGARFIYYFDRVWAVELAGGWARHNTFYNADNTDITGVDISLKTTLIPVQLGVRYAFDVKKLPRSFALMNPYLAFDGELIFRSESVQGSPTVLGLNSDQQIKYAAGSVSNSTAFGTAFGGGLEFDVYRNQLFLGMDLRYHLVFWTDSSEIIGAIDRRGHYFTILGSLTYNY